MGWSLTWCLLKTLMSLYGWIGNHGYLATVSMPMLPCQFTFVPKKLNLNEGPENMDIVLYLLMRNICNANMCFVE